MKLKIWFLNVALLSVLTLSAQGKFGNITDIEIDGPVIVNLVPGAAAGIEVLKESELVSWEVNGSSLVIMAQYHKDHDTPEIEVTVGDLQSLSTTGSVILEGAGEFATRRLELSISGQSIVSLEVDVENLIVRATSQSIVNFSGKADDLNLSINNQSVANTEELQCAVIEVSANNQSVANINADGARVSKNVRNQSLVVDK